MWPAQIQIQTLYRGKSRAKRKRSDEEPKCSICIGYKNSPLLTLPCGHQFHQSCLRDWSYTKTSCPNCREEFMKCVKIVYKVAENPPFQFELPDEIMGFQFKAQENVPNPNIVSKVYKGPTPLVDDFVNLINKNLRDLRKKKAIASIFDVIVLSREVCEPILDSWYQHNNQ